MKTHTMLFVVAVCAAACVGADNAAVAGHGAGVNARQQAGAPHAHGAFPQAIGAEKLSMSLPYPSNPPIARVAIFQEQDPYGSTIIQNILASNGIAYTIFGTNDMGVVDLGPYDKVVIPSAQTTDFYARVQFHALWFQEYAFGGGIIEMHLASEAAQPVDGFFMPGGFLSVRYPTNAVTLGNADFPMLRRPHGIVNAMLQNWDSSAYGYFVFYPYGARRIVTIAGTNLPCAVDAPYGAGRIFATLQPVEWVFASQDYLENMLLYAGYNNVAILQDRIPWVNYVTNATYQNGMNERVLASNFIAYTIFGTSEMRFVDYSPYDKVIVAGDQGSN
ncbi:hypothetical protein GX586_08950, partial [bacterium]|nr:hypothetical protein [bacterium]